MRRRVIVSFAGQPIDSRPGGRAVEARGRQVSGRGRAFRRRRGSPGERPGQASLRGELAPATQAPDRGTSAALHFAPATRR